MTQDDERPPLAILLHQLGLGASDFHAILEARGVHIAPRALRRYLAPLSASSSRTAPEDIMVVARELSGLGAVGEWIVGSDEASRRVLIHAWPPRFCAVLQHQRTIGDIEWWDPAVEEERWREEARLAAERLYHRSWRERTGRA